MAVTTALVIVSHSAALATGIRDLAGQMAPDVEIAVAGGLEDGGLGTSFDLIEKALDQVLVTPEVNAVILTDLGSATLTAESVLEFRDDDRALLVDAPLVEGAVAAAVVAQTGGDQASVAAAATEAVMSFKGSGSRSANAQPPAAAQAGPVPASVLGAEQPSTASGSMEQPAAGADRGSRIVRSVTLRNSDGLHARPAAIVARIAAEHDAKITINGVDASSLLSLMGLGVPGGADVEIAADGAGAEAALAELVEQFETGFGED